MGYVHEVEGEHFGLEERSESFVITFGGDREEHGIFVHALRETSGGIELSFERIAELRRLLEHPALKRKMFKELSELADTLPLHYTPEEFDALLLKMAKIHKRFGEDYMVEIYEKVVEKNRRERDDISD